MTSISLLLPSVPHIPTSSLYFFHHGEASVHPSFGDLAVSAHRVFCQTGQKAPSSFLLFPVSVQVFPFLSVHNRVSHFHQGEGHEVSRIYFARVSVNAHLSQAHPRLCHVHVCFHLVWLFGSTIMLRGSHMFPPTRILHLCTCLRVSNTAFGLCGQTHTMALLILSAMTSDRNGNYCFSTWRFIQCCGAKSTIQNGSEQGQHKLSARSSWRERIFALFCGANDKNLKKQACHDNSGEHTWENEHFTLKVTNNVVKNVLKTRNNFTETRDTGFSLKG